jgi:hypothetical protein
LLEEAAVVVLLFSLLLVEVVPEVLELPQDFL